MIITKQTIGTGKNRHAVYDLCNSIADTGEQHPDRIARFTTLEAAAAVLRYLQGVDDMSVKEIELAENEIRKTAAPTG